MSFAIFLILSKISIKKDIAIIINDEKLMGKAINTSHFLAAF